MIYDKNNGTVVYDAGGAKGVRLYESSGNEYVHLTIEPGSNIPEHSLPIPVSFCVLKGTGTVTVDDVAQTLTEGQMIECPPDVPRGWSNSSSDELEILVIKRIAP